MITNLHIHGIGQQTCNVDLSFKLAELACMECGHLTQELKTIRVIPRVSIFRY